MDPITEQQVAAWLKMHEGEVLDFKERQYAIRAGGEHARAAFIKDILAFANTLRTSEAAILCGVKEEAPGNVQVCGVVEHLADADLQQMVSEKTNRPVRFRYERVEYEGKDLGVIRIERRQSRPLYLRNNYGQLRANIVYVRRGSSTGEATPDEIQQMTLLPTTLPMDGEKIHPNLKQLAERWLSIFDNHKIQRSQIPTVLARRELPPVYFHRWESVLQVLNDDLIEETCRLFNIDRRWLDGDSPHPFRPLWLDGRLRAVLRGMVEMRSRNKETTVIGLKSKRSGLEEDPNQLVSVVIRSTVTVLNDQPVDCYLPVATGPNFEWSDEKARRYLKEIFIAGHYLDMYLSGLTLDKRTIAALSEGELFPDVAFKRTKHAVWHPDDFIFDAAESAVAKESSDLGRLRRHIAKSGLLEDLRAARRLIPGLESDDPPYVVRTRLSE